MVKANGCTRGKQRVILGSKSICLSCSNVPFHLMLSSPPKWMAIISSPRYFSGPHFYMAWAHTHLCYSDSRPILFLFFFHFVPPFLSSCVIFLMVLHVWVFRSLHYRHVVSSNNFNVSLKGLLLYFLVNINQKKKCMGKTCHWIKLYLWVRY